MIDEEKDLKAERKAEDELKALILLALLFGWSRNRLEAEAYYKIVEIELSNPHETYKTKTAMWAYVGFWLSQMGVTSVKADTEEDVFDIIKSISETEPKTESEDTGFAGEQLLTPIERNPLGENKPTRKTSLYDHLASINRQEEHKRQIDEELKQGDLFLISVHRGCSERCFPDQGKLVSKSMRSIDKDLWTGMRAKNGRKIYSLPDMLARTDRYGYHNFIISGFNCRHHLTPYKDETIGHVLKEESEEVSKEERERSAMERRLRKLNELAYLCSKAKLKKAKRFREAYNALKGLYLEKCEKAHLEPREWRCL